MENINSDPIRILQVDDDEEDFLLIEDLLRDISRQLYTIEWAPDFDDAMHKIKTAEYDICLVDFMLGKYTGIDLLKNILQQNPYLPVIIFTGQGDEKVDIAAMEAGAADYLVKGHIDANTLERSIRYSLKQAQAQQKLVENEKSLRTAEKFAVTGRVAQVIAHEIRNPLTNVKLAVQQLEDETLDCPDSTKGLFLLIDRNCDRINQLITNLLDSTKFSELKYEDVSINQVLDEAIELARDRIELKKIKIERFYSDDICDVNVDREKIKIALLNIIINAIEAVKEDDGVINISTESKNDKCVVTISDNGPGMDDEQLNKIFEPFYSKKQKGTGLGLTTTQNIVLNHKASIKVESKLGKGTHFILTFEFSPNVVRKQQVS
jgi:signal transduction histidine kinase